MNPPADALRHVETKVGKRLNTDIDTVYTDLDDRVSATNAALDFAERHALTARVHRAVDSPGCCSFMFHLQASTIP